jgi:ribosomal-protein-alanine N-acetyltransferase
MCGMTPPVVPDVIETKRLLLRPPRLEDAPRVALLAGDRDVAGGTLLIPHPYEERFAVEWIRGLAERPDRGESVKFMITLRETREVIGAIGLRILRDHARADLGYWLGKDYWNLGYATEAGRAVVRHGFETCGLRRITAGHFTRNPASGRVLQKIGMTHEGRLRRHFKRWNVFEDCEIYGILREELEAGP